MDFSWLSFWTQNKRAKKVHFKLLLCVLENVVDSLETKAEKWIHFHFHPIFPCLYFSLSYCVVTFLVDNALARVELCHTLATKLDSLQEMKLCKNDAGSDKDENGEAKKKSIFYI